MTLPNKLTLGRIMAIPAMVVVACIPYLNKNYLGDSTLLLSNFINVIIFTLASITDFLDGYIARKTNKVTTFGKFADPLADKMLVLTSFLILLEQSFKAQFGNIDLAVVPLWGVAIILVRELTVSGIRLVAAQRGEVIAAGWAGKVKTAETMIALIVLFFAGVNNIIAIIGLILMYISVVLTIYSGCVYFYRSRKLIFESI